jgi:hypothetical protein
VKALRRLAACASLLLVAGCGPEPLAARSWPALDSADVGEPFSPSFLLADQDLEDGTFLVGDAVQAFLEKPPYGPPSFLATYTEKGRRAADLVAEAASRHRVSALWLLARLERDGALVAARRYPAESKDVEYVFSYGCSGRLLCDPTFGGLGVQVDALAGEVRRTLDDLRRAGVTANGFAKGASARTLDGVVVEPASDATAALYGVEPVVAGPGGGQALAWRIYRLYSNHVGYFPLGPDTP